MAVLIEGMEMPKSCGSCKLFGASHAIGLFSPLGWCRVNGKEIFRLSEKADFCPLVEVPEPHGDLIDRDKLRAKEFIHNGDAYAVVMSRDIRNAPTVIRASVEGEA